MENIVVDYYTVTQEVPERMWRMVKREIVKETGWKGRIRLAFVWASPPCHTFSVAPAGHQCMEDVQLQGSSQTWQATSGRQHEACEGGSEVRQAGPASPHQICMGRITEGGLGDGESSGLAGLQAIHEAYEDEACEAPGQLLGGAS